MLPERTLLEEARQVLSIITQTSQDRDIPEKWLQSIEDFGVSPFQLVAKHLKMEVSQLEAFLAHPRLHSLISKLEMTGDWKPTDPIPENWRQAQLLQAFGILLDSDVSAEDWEKMLDAYRDALNVSQP